MTTIAQKEAEDKAARDKAAARTGVAGSKEGEAAPPVVGYPDRHEIGMTDAELGATRAANEKVATANKEQADAAAKASAGGEPTPAAKKPAANDDDDGEDSASRRRTR